MLCETGGTGIKALVKYILHTKSILNKSQNVENCAEWLPGLVIDCYQGQALKCWGGWSIINMIFKEIMIMVAIYVDDNVYYFHEELCLSEGDQMMMMVNVMMMMLMITMMVVMMMTPISGSFSEVGGMLSPITW